MGRRAFHINKKFQKKVALHTGHTMEYKQLSNNAWTVGHGSCFFSQLDIGYVGDNDVFLDYARRHWAGFHTTDPNTTNDGITQFKMKLKVMNFSRTIVGVNSSNNKMYIECWSLSPRHNIHNPNLFPFTALSTYLQGGDLPDSGTAAHLIGDVDLSPFDCPALTANYKFGKKRFFCVHPGGSFTIKVQNSYDITMGLDKDVSGWDPTLQIKKGQYKAVLIKMYGGLGVLTNATSKYIRNMETEAIARVIAKATLHVSREERKIYYNNGLSAERDIPSVTAAEAINEEVADVQGAVVLGPLTTL